LTRLRKQVAWIVPFAGLSLAIATSQHSLAQTPADPDASTAASVSDPESDTTSDDDLIPFILNIQGLAPTGLEERFKSLSLLQQRQKNKSDSRGRLARRLAEDTTTLDKLLRAEGYFSATFETSVSPAPGPRGSVVVFLKVVPGKRFVFGKVITPGAPGIIGPLNMRSAGVYDGAPAITNAILDAEARMKVALPRAGYPFFKFGEMDVLVDHATQLVDVTLPVTSGAKARFGKLTFTSDDVARPEHLKNLSRFKEGASYDARELDDLREALLSTSLYANLNVRTVARADNPEIADVFVDGSPAKTRTIAVTAGYGTSEGPKVEASWQHRNLFGGEERVTILGRAGTIEQTLRADFQKSNFRKRDQNLIGRTVFARQDTDAFDSLSVELAGGIERVSERIFQKKWIYSVSGELLLTRERLTGGPRATYYVASIPATVRYDGSNDLFDPTRGFRVAAVLIPEVSFRDVVSTYAATELSASYYKTFGEKRPVTLAARVRAGSIIGADLDNISATRRFYSGGGGSIRGFNYQGVGPVNPVTGAPVGGRSLTEASLEVRVKVTDTIGIVPFLDAGNVYASVTPKFSGYRYGAGIGVRYYTAFAPVRVDIARALGRRAGDPKFAVYVSIGQSF
jgi:translocation and assembly module TamA